jgi:phosphonate transport system substrate-binding protein
MKTLAAVLALSTALTGVAHAQGISEFRIGILGGENAQDRMNSNECFRAYTEELLGVPTRLFAPADYNGVMQGLLGGTIDLAWLGPSSYAAVFIENPNAIEPILVKVNTDGTYGYFAIGFARADSGITSFDDLKGKSFAFGDPNSGSGYLIPRIEIEDNGYSLKPGEFFSDVVFSGGHEQSIVGVANGDFDASVTWADALGEWEDGYNSGALRKAADSGIVDMNDLVQIWQSNVIPEGPIVVRQALPERVKIEMTAMLAALPYTDPACAYAIQAGDALGFRPIDHSAYEVIVESRKRISN